MGIIVAGGGPLGVQLTRNCINQVYFSRPVTTRVLCVSLESYNKILIIDIALVVVVCNGAKISLAAVSISYPQP